MPGTHTFLRLLISDEPIAKADLARTILQTQKELREFITMYDASGKILNPLEDPFESSPEWEGCFFGLRSYPLDQECRLTYGMVADTLQGIWEYMYRGGRYVGAIFEVNDDTVGRVGVGKISVSKDPLDPPDSGVVGRLGSGNFTEAY